MLVAAFGGLYRVVVVFEGRQVGVRRLKEHLAFGAARHFVAVLVADVQDARQRLADRTLLVEPFLAGDEGRAVAFGPGVIFIEHRTPPGDHRFLDRDRDRRGRVDRALQGGDVVLVAHVFRQLEHADEMGGHELAVGDLVLLDRRQRGFGIELLHHHHGATDLVHGHRPAQRRGVIERRGREVDRVLVDAIGHHRQLDEDIGRIDRRIFGQRDLHPLGAAGGAGGVEHVDPGALVRNWSGGHLGQRVFGGEFTRRVHAQLGNVWRQLGYFVQRRGQIGRTEQQLGTAVFQDISDFRRGQAAGNANIMHPGALEAPGQAEEPRMVFHAQRHRIANLNAAGAEQLRDLVRTRVELAIGDRFAAAGHDDGGLVRVALRIDRRMHGESLS